MNIYEQFDPTRQEPSYVLELSQEELRLLRFDCSMAMAFSQFDRYNFLPLLLEITDDYS